MYIDGGMGKYLRVRDIRQHKNLWGRRFGNRLCAQEHSSPPQSLRRLYAYLVEIAWMVNRNGSLRKYDGRVTGS